MLALLAPLLLLAPQGSAPLPPSAVIPSVDPMSRFGAAVDLSGDTLVVGAPDSDLAGNGQGAVYVYTLSPGSIDLTAILTPGNTGTFGQFGSAVSIDGDTIAVGYPYEGSGRGEVYVFRRGPVGWPRVAILTDASFTSDLFGSAVALDGDTLAVGAPGSCIGVICEPEEKVQVFERDAGGPENWGRIAWLGSLSGGICADYGTYVDLAEDTLVTSDGPQTGFCGGYDAYVYRRDQAPAPFGLEERLKAPPWDGSGLAMNGPLATTGRLLAVAGRSTSPCRDGMSVFERSNDTAPWTRITAIIWRAPIRYPTAVTMDQDYLAAGRRRAVAGTGGEVELRQRNLGGANAYGVRGVLLPDDGLAGDNGFGAALALDGGRLVVGAPGSGQAVGAVYLFDLP